MTLTTTDRHDRPPTQGYRCVEPEHPGLLARVVGVLMATGDVVWGNFRPSFFDPAPLSKLAEHMRDGRWLHLQTEDGALVRVRITEIRVYTQGEDIVLRQEWLDGAQEFQHRQVVIDSESIWKATPIKMTVSEVPPPLETRVADCVEVFGVILNVLIADTGLTTGQLTAGGRGDNPAPQVEARHCGLVLMYEMTNESPQSVCERFGYGSPTAWHHARAKMQSQPGFYEDFRKDTKRRAREVWKQLGHVARRTKLDGREPLI